MPQGHSDALWLFMRHKKLEDADWIRLIEYRLEEIRPYLKDMQLKPFSDIEFLQTESWLHNLRHQQGQPEIVGFPSKHGLEVQGLYFIGKDTPAHRGLDRRNRTSVFGILRNGKLVRIDVDLVKEGGYKGRGYERATRVHLSLTTVEAMQATPGFEVLAKFCDFLAEQVEAFVERRRTLYEDAQALGRQFSTEQALLTVLNQRGEG